MPGASPEALLISAVVRGRDVVGPIKSGITRRLFHVHPVEWEWIEDYQKRNRRPPSKAAFRQRFPEFRLYAVDDVEHYTNEVKRDHARHELIELLNDGTDLLRDDQDPMEVTKNFHRRMIILTGEVEGREYEADILADPSGVLEEVRRRISRVDETGMAGVPTGFPTLDERTGGPGPGDYWVVAARLGQGKTWTMIRMAVEAMLEGYRVQFDALEQTKAQIAMRLHAFLSEKLTGQQFRHSNLMRGKNFDLAEYKRFLAAVQRQYQGFFVSDASRGRVNALSVASQIERNQPDIVFIDYLTLMEGGGQDWQKVGELSSDIKGLAQRYSIPVVVAAQVNRQALGDKQTGGFNAMPEPEHLSRADAIGQDADVVLTMKKETEHLLRMKLAKNRHGRGGFQWWCQFTPDEGIFEEVDQTRASEIKEMDREDVV